MSKSITEKLITRTVKACVVSLTVFDVVNATISHPSRIMDISFNKLSNEAKLNEVRKAYETATEKIVGVDISGTTEQKYACTLAQFMSVAHKVTKEEEELEKEGEEGDE